MISDPPSEKRPVCKERTRKGWGSELSCLCAAGLYRAIDALPATTITGFQNILRELVQQCGQKIEDIQMQIEQASTSLPFGAKCECVD